MSVKNNMNFFNNQSCDEEYNSYLPHKFDNQDFRASRNSKTLYNFQKNNPFDENIDWQLFTEHYEKGTLNHDYKITYKPALRYLNMMKNTKTKRLMESSIIDSNKNISFVNENLNDMHSIETQETIQKMHIESALDKKDDAYKSRNFCLFKSKKHLTNIEMHENKAIGKTDFRVKEKKNADKTKPKKEERRSFFLWNNHLFERSTSYKKRKSVNFYKKTFCVTAACTAFISTTALVTTATVFPPLLPICLPMLLPVTLASNGIVLFKAKKKISKLNTHIQTKSERFIINLDAKTQTLKLKSKLLFRKSTLNEPAKPKSNAEMLWNTELSMNNNDMQTVSEKNQNKNISSCIHNNFSTAEQTSTVLNSSKRLKKKKKHTYRKEKPVFIVSDDTSEEEQRDTISFKYYQHKPLENYLKLNRYREDIVNDHNSNFSNDLKNEQKNGTNKNSISDLYSKLENPDNEDSVCKKNMPTLNSFCFEPTTLRSVKQTAVEFCDYFKL